MFDAGGIKGAVEAPLSYRRKTEQEKTDHNNWWLLSHSAKAVYVKMGPKKEKYLAVLVGANDLTDRYGIFNILYIYNPNGILVYHETKRAHNSDSLSVLPNENGTESLLINEGGKLFKYKINEII